MTGSWQQQSGSQQGSFAVVVAIAVILDATTKIAAVRLLDGVVHVGVLDLRLTYNSGLAFGVGAGRPPALTVAVTAAVVVVLAIAALRGHLGGPVSSGLVVERVSVSPLLQITRSS